MKILIFIILTVINLSNQKNIELNGHITDITYLAVLNDNVTLASGSFDGEIKIWNVTGNQLIITLKNHNQSIDFIAEVRN
jgi:WD40 repeat protein